MKMNIYMASNNSDILVTIVAYVGAMEHTL
jgi:hypothetical protein